MQLGTNENVEKFEDIWKINLNQLPQDVIIVNFFHGEHFSCEAIAYNLWNKVSSFFEYLL